MFERKEPAVKEQKSDPHEEEVVERPNKRKEAPIEEPLPTAKNPKAANPPAKRFERSSSSKNGTNNNTTVLSFLD